MLSQYTLKQLTWLLDAVDAIERKDNKLLQRLHEELKPGEYLLLKRKLKNTALAAKDWLDANARGNN